MASNQSQQLKIHDAPHSPIGSPKMCRMLAVVPRKNTRVDSEIVRSFRKLASCGMVPPNHSPGHSDGWGMLVWKNGRPVYLGREATDAWKDAKFEEACGEIDSLRITSPLIVHLRKASIGVKSRENTHPFVVGEWGFAHNGTIRKLKLKVTTDSQWFFESLMREYFQNGGNMVRAIEHQISFVHGTYPYTSITFLLSDGRDLYAYRDCTRFLDYYGMYYAIKENSIVIAQEKFFESNWNLIDNGQLLHVNENLQHEIINPVPNIVA